MEGPRSRAHFDGAPLRGLCAEPSGSLGERATGALRGPVTWSLFLLRTWHRSPKASSSGAARKFRVHCVYAELVFGEPYWTLKGSPRRKAVCSLVSHRCAAFRASACFRTSGFTWADTGGVQTLKTRRGVARVWLNTGLSHLRSHAVCGSSMTALGWFLLGVDSPEVGCGCSWVTLVSG